jgi:hypothetical protein
MNVPNLSALAVRERPLTLFFILVTALAGTLAFLQLGRAEDPTFTIKTMTVAVIWPGASAEEMEEQVADRLEKRLQDLRWFDHVNTLSRPGVTFLTVWLSDRTPPAQVAEQFYQVRKRMEDEAPNLPRGTIGPIVNDEYGDNNFALYALQAAGMPHRDLVREAEDIRARLLRVPGAKSISLASSRAASSLNSRRSGWPPWASPRSSCSPRWCRRTPWFRQARSRRAAPASSSGPAALSTASRKWRPPPSPQTGGCFGSGTSLR